MRILTLDRILEASQPIPNGHDDEIRSLTSLNVPPTYIILFFALDKWPGLPLSPSLREFSFDSASNRQAGRQEWPLRESFPAISGSCIRFSRQEINVSRYLPPPSGLYRVCRWLSESKPSDSGPILVGASERGRGYLLV